jgi:hypothetical protein
MTLRLVKKNTLKHRRFEICTTTFVMYAVLIYEGESINRSQIDIKRNPQHRGLLSVISATSAPPFQPLRHQRNVCHQGGTVLRDKHFPP